MNLFPLLFSFLNGEKVSYVVLRNYDDLPEKTLPGSDIDLLVCSKDKARYISALKRAVDKTDSIVVSKAERKNCLSFLIYQGKLSGDCVWIDAFWELSSRSFKWGDENFLLENRVFNQQKDFFVPAEGCEAAALFAKGIFGRDFIKDRYKARIKDFASADRGKFISTLSPYLGGKTAREFADVCEKADWKKAAKKRNSWFLELSLRSFFKNPFGQPIYFLRFIFGYIGKSLFRRGMVIVLAGPDGVGKTAASDNLQQIFKNIYFNKIYRYHGHFGFFPEWAKVYGIFRKKRASGSDAPREEKKAGSLKAVLSILYYGLEHILAWLWILWLRARGNLIIFDRYFYDFAVMNSSSEFPKKIFRFMSKLIYRPDILFVLRADPQIIFDRKKELSIKEIKRQDGIFRDKNILNLARVIFIDAEKPIGAVSSDIKEEILKKLSEKQF
jgi:thymidylate kinase